MILHLPAEQVQVAVESVAVDLLREAGVVEPPIDALAVARRLGMVLLRDGRAETRARLVRLRTQASGRDAIYLADEPRPERRQWAVAHELGELAAARVFALLGVDPIDAAQSAREDVANRLASCLLLPGNWFGADGAACDWDLLQLKAIYVSASHELIARRMLNQRPPIVVTLLDQGEPRWRRSNCFERPPRISESEWAAWRGAHELGLVQGCSAASLPRGVAEVTAWPVHEPGWKREILRTAVAEMW